MNFQKTRQRKRRLLVDMTPMIDIVFQLLIFFLTTAQLAQHSRADIELPIESGEESAESEAAGMIINITASGEIILSDEAMDLDELRFRVQQLVRREASGSDDGFKPLIRADRNSPTAVLNDVLKVLQSAGVPNVRLGTNPASGGEQ
ncbi:MAG: hypothetical protein CMJ32_00695 [Phycisphaerae bacterium]|nr:hypothetical protein [Phycisphaerae bacterium]